MMHSQLSLHNNTYFNQLTQQISNLSCQQSHIASLSKQRTHLYKQSLNGYEIYLKKQSQALHNNIRHTNLRNQYYLAEVKRAWRNGISNRSIVLRSLARTNVVKGDAEEWIRGLEGFVDGVGDGDGGDQRGNLGVQDGELIRRYQEILREFNSK